MMQLAKSTMNSLKRRTIDWSTKLKQQIRNARIAPRGDADVAKYNECIDRLADHWRNRDVKESNKPTSTCTGEMVCR